MTDSILRDFDPPLNARYPSSTLVEVLDHVEELELRNSAMKFGGIPPFTSRRTVCGAQGELILALSRG